MSRKQGFKDTPLMREYYREQKAKLQSHSFGVKVLDFKEAEGIYRQTA